jgi:hypothetical protein
MFNFVNNEKKEAIAAEKREQNFAREMKTAETQHSDDSTYLETQTQKSDLIRWQQEFDAELENLKHELLSEVKTSKGWEQKAYKEFDSEKRVYVEKRVSPLCSVEFAEKIIRVAVRPWLNKNAVNSHLSEKTILKMLRNTHNDIVGAISDSWGYNGINSLDDANNICRMIKNYIDPAAYRSLEGWTKRTDSTMIKRIESQQDVINQQQTGFLAGLFKGGG